MSRPTDIGNASPCNVTFSGYRNNRRDSKGDPVVSFLPCPTKHVPRWRRKTFGVVAYLSPLHIDAKSFWETAGRATAAARPSSQRNACTVSVLAKFSRCGCTTRATPRGRHIAREVQYESLTARERNSYGAEPVNVDWLSHVGVEACCGVRRKLLLVPSHSDTWDVLDALVLPPYPPNEIEARAIWQSHVRDH